MKYKVNFINTGYQRQYKKWGKPMLKAVAKAAKYGDFVLRDEVDKFEAKLCEYTGAKYAVAVNSGTDALKLSLIALGLGAGDEVITVGHTFIASIQEIVHCGAKPVLIDVAEDALMDVSLIERAITPYTKAILPVHLSGKVCEMNMIMQIANKHQLSVIEDACQALGATYNGKQAGTIGDTGCFSFISPKLLGAWGDNGAVVTDSPVIYKKLMLLRNHWNITQGALHGLKIEQPDEMGWGFNSRMDNIQAAVLNVKFPHYDWILSRRKEICERYLAEFQGLPIKLPTTQEGQVWQEFIVRVPDAMHFKEFMRKKGVEVLVRDTTPNHRLKGLGLEHFNLPVTDQMASACVRLPSYPELRDSEVEYIIKCVKQYANLLS